MFVKCYICVIHYVTIKQTNVGPKIHGAKVTAFMKEIDNTTITFGDFDFSTLMIEYKRAMEEYNT